MKNHFVLGIAMLLSLMASAQTTVKVMSYNVLNFPTGEIPNREDSLKTILNFVEPDLLLLQELKTAEGLADIASVSFEDFDDVYQASTFIPQVSNPNTSWPLQQGIVFNTRVFGLAEESVVTSTYRDFNRFKLYFNDEALENGADTTFLYVYVTHLKSSQGADNEQLRLEMVEDFVAHLESMPSDAMVLLGGDFNLYDSAEPAYQLLLNESNPVVFLDPIDAPGEWHSSSYPFKHILTQSTRAKQIYNDGAGGGLDDRFDFVLTSASLFDSSMPINFVEDSYSAFGNNGDCYNGDILDCIPNNQVPDDVMHALYYMSDHLPVVLELETEINLAISPRAEPKPFEFQATFYQGKLEIHSTFRAPTLFKVELFSLQGKVLLNESVQASTGKTTITFNVSDLGSGCYVVRLSGEFGGSSKKVLWVE